MDYQFLSQLITAVTPVFVPLVVAFIKKVQSFLPKWSLPIVAAVLGSVADIVNGFVTGNSVGLLWGAVLGGAGVALRDVVNQIKGG